MSSPSSTPPALTPDYTGSADSSSHADAAVKKARRQTAFYPNVNSTNKPVNPFSRSAAKRQSVMTLGSIEHLQHYFTKTGIAAKSNPSKKLNNGLVPAIGGIASMKAKGSLGSLLEFELPPSPVVPESRPAIPQFIKTFETDPEAFLPGVVEDLSSVVQAWRLDRSSPTTDSPTRDPNLLSPHKGDISNSTFDVLSVLKTTTHAIRSVRNYVVALPDESAGTLRTQYRNKVASSSPAKRVASSPKTQPDPLTMIRKSALEVLSTLRELEERSRVPLSDDAYDAQSDHNSSQGQSPRLRVASPSALSDDGSDLRDMDPDTSISFVRVQGRYDSIPVWEDENDTESHNLSEEEREKREHWDDRLVLGGGWLYKQDIKLEDLGKEKAVIQRYIDVVDDVLFGGSKDGKKGWERERDRAAKREKDGRGKGRRVSAGDAEGQFFRFPPSAERSSRRVVSSSILDGLKDLSMVEEPEAMETLSEEESVDEEDLPEWSKRDSFPDDSLGRAHALLQTLLPDYLLPSLPSTSERDSLLLSLSSGQLLCVAYNTAVRRSRKPWGYISLDSIHDIVALEQTAEHVDDKSKTGWTFRRIDNLRLWAAALKLRYLLPVIVPSAPSRPEQLRASQSTPTSSPTKVRFPTNDPPVIFDPRLVARKDDGWESMLEAVVLQWVNVVVEERRGER
ncbi:hypothetical protein BJ138DRAFT_1142950 [Hygrophoropsis aurantiaca]|uniref:Uncharacterized protein n=1 Tax=Hygrophoropsis aurantiaca TaxID=72124 RepID=A0ACB8APQ6_9AGAM|nr:hypothetical protein BJ138DRAFT_1142950 [Hygrophoropsis aurantiaca]